LLPFLFHFSFFSEYLQETRQCSQARTGNRPSCSPARFCAIIFFLDPRPPKRR
jgi:hypothetical protein